jgi:hypothetical protein
MALEMVIWRDAYFEREVPEHPRKDFLMKTVGWTKEGEKFLRIVGERGPEGAKRAVTYVPNENVIERRRLS